MVEHDASDDDNNSINATKKKNKNKASKKRRRNPLSHARGKQQSHESIWFRRIGAGYHLFAEYYAGQPMGTLCDEPNGVLVVAEDKDDTTVPSRSSSSSDPTKQHVHEGAGLSRAAKRRKKKKQKNSNNSSSVNVNADTGSAPASVSAGANTEQFPESSFVPKKNKEIDSEYDLHPLLEALNKQSTRKTTTHSTTVSEQSRNIVAALRPCFRALSKPLPVTFRLRRTLNNTQKQRLQTQLQEEFQFLVKPLPFGNGYIYQARCSKVDLTKKYTALKTFLVDHSQNGTLARQDVGSMLPLLALEEVGAIGSTKKCRVLDLCASPGSKTLQALELIQAKHPGGGNNGRGGRILANDVSESRLQALQDAIERSGMMTTLEQEEGGNNNTMIGYTCEDARQLATSKPAHVIVCDVPCSGDGTVRKDPHILELWKPSQGNALHTLQLQILQRALSLVKVGGIVCYSTCSLNPVENEAVVAAALKQSNNNHEHNNNKINGNKTATTNHKDAGKSRNPTAQEQESAVELLDFPTIPGFQRRPGLSHWRVADYLEHRNDKDDDEDDEIPHLVWYDTYRDARKNKMENAVATMWPAQESTTGKNDDDECNNPLNHMDRCTRLWPQDHDTGGFFLALIRRNH